jgi:MerR family transcriptional regulator, heat shock protein HspR
MALLLILGGGLSRQPPCIVCYRFLIANETVRVKGLERGGVVAERSVGVFGISVAADMLSMQVQNLRVYERHGLVEPDRTTGGTRLYSHDDLDRLARIRDLLAEGLNLAGITRVLALEAEVDRLRSTNQRLRQRDR